jgi:hypothetical protein
VLLYFAGVYHAIPYPLGSSAARDRIEQAFEHYRVRFAALDPTLTWETVEEGRVDVTLFGRRVVVRVAVGPQAIELEAEVPVWLRPFQARAVEVLEREARRWLDGTGLDPAVTDPSLDPGQGTRASVELDPG